MKYISLLLAVSSLCYAADPAQKIVKRTKPKKMVLPMKFLKKVELGEGVTFTHLGGQKGVLRIEGLEQSESYVLTKDGQDLEVKSDESGAFELLVYGLKGGQKTIRIVGKNYDKTISL